jgi:hypothetical protein
MCQFYQKLAYTYIRGSQTKIVQNDKKIVPNNKKLRPTLRRSKTTFANRLCCSGIFPHLDGGNDDLNGGELAVDAEAEEHQEEGDGPELGPGHLRKRMGEDDKHEARPISHHILLVIVVVVR